MWTLSFLDKWKFQRLSFKNCKTLQNHKKPYHYYFQKDTIKLFPLTPEKSNRSVLWPYKCLDLLPVRPN